MERKLSALQLSGLTIGPILGSGIILLPPLAYEGMGPSVIYLWLAIMALGALFGWIFSALSIKYPGDGGVMNAIEGAFGEKFKNLGSLFLMSAVTCGPAAVMYTAAVYLQKVFGGSVYVITGALVVLAFILLQMKLKNIGNISFVISTLTAIILVASSLYSLMGNGIHIGSVESLSIVESMNMLMLLFWAIVGWEIIGVYSDAVENPKRTIPLSTIISIIVISFVYIIVALAYQSFDNPVDFVSLLTPIMGGSANLVLALFITGLCVTTYLLVVGAAVRLLVMFSKNGLFPAFFSRKDQRDNPVYAIGTYSLIHLLIIVLLANGILNLETILAFANGFFIANAGVGVSAAFKVLDSLVLRIGSILLLICFIALFLALSPWMMVLIFVISFSYLKPWDVKKVLDHRKI